MPILEHFGYKATLFVVAGRVGQTADWLGPLGEGQRPMLDWPALRDLASRGIEIGAHTMSHPQLDILPPALAKQEITDSKALLERELAHPVSAFAYPHGYANPTIRALVAAAGFHTACRVRHALSATSENRFALSRIIMTEDIDDAALATLLAGHGLPVAPPVDRLVSSGWRWVRRLDRAIRSTAQPAWQRRAS
jgi:peptidoglycan/xylan/chitin deacetylase (PgdA/CDA1 family)